MEDKRYTIDNIQDFYDEIDSSPNGKFNKLRIYYSYQHEQERIAKENEITEELKWSGCYSYATLIGDDMAVVTHEEKNHHKVYQPWVKGKHRDTCYLTFDEALLACVSIKHTGVEFSADYMYKLIKE